MPTYLAVYKTNAMMYDGGAWMKDPDSHRDEYKFDADSDFEAGRMAEEHIVDIAGKYVQPKVTLEQLMKVEDVKVKQ